MYVKQENLTKRKQNLLKKRNFIKKEKFVTKIPLFFVRNLWIFHGCPADLLLLKHMFMGRLYEYIRTAIRRPAESRGYTLDFDMVCSRLADDKTYRKKGKEFRDVCYEFGAARTVLDNMLYECVGMSGDEVMVRLRSRKPYINV